MVPFQNDFKYNYVIFGTNMDLYEIAYSEIKEVKNARYLVEGISTKNPLLKTLYRVHTSERVNMIVNLPFKNIWNSLAYVRDFENDKPICYIFFAGVYWFSKEYINYLRKTEPNCKIVVFYQDLIKTHVELFRETKDLVDLNVTFDQGDAEQYNIVYHPLVYSKYNIVDEGYRSDVYFVGKAKDRLDEIINIYEQLSSYGLSCDFHITGVSKDKQVYCNKIHYCKQMPYKKNLSHILGTKCILEIMQGGGKGFTLRYAEAIMYNKKMITNNSEIVRAPFYSKEKILAITGAEDINKEFISSLDKQIDYSCKQELSPVAFLNFIDAQISIAY